MADANKSVNIELRAETQKAMQDLSAFAAFFARTIASVESSAASTSSVTSRIAQGFSGAFNVIKTGATSAFTGLVNIVGSSLGKVQSFLGGLMQQSKLASLFIGGAAVGIGGKLIQMTADVEQTRVAFETLLGSAEKAGDLMSWIVDISIQTPVARKQVQDLARTFLAYDHTLEETKTAVMATIEATSALGISETRLNAITYNLGQLATSTTASYREFRDLQKQGINTAKLLAGAVNDGSLALSGFGKGASTAAGPSKTLTNQFQKASQNLDIYKRTLQAAEMDLKKLSDAGKEGTSAFLRKQNAVDKARVALQNAEKTMGEYDRVSASAGKTIAGVSKNLETLTREQQEMILKQNTGKDIAKALEEQMLKTYGGAAMRQVKSLSGILSNFGDVFQLVLQRAMGISAAGEVEVGGAFDTIRNAAAKLVELLLNNVNTISDFFNKILSNKDNLIGIAAILVGMLLPAILGIIGPIVLMGGGIGAMVAFALPKIRELIGRFGGMEVVVGKAREAIEKIRDRLIELSQNEQVITILKGIAAVVGGVLVASFLAWLAPIAKVALVLFGLGAIIGPLVEKLGGFEGIGAGIVSAWGTISQFFTETLLPAFQRFVNEVAPPFIEAFKQMGPALQQFWEALKPILPILGAIILMVLAFAGAIITGLLTAFAKVLPNIIGIFTGIIQFFTGFWQFMAALFSGNMELLRQGWNNLWQGIYNIASNFFGGIINLVVGFVEGVINFFKGLYQALVGGSIVWDIVNGITDAFTQLKGRVIDLVSGLIGSVRDKFTGMVNDVKNWGREMVEGFVNSFREAAKRAGDLGRDIAGRFGFSFQHGGIVPGPVGAPVPAILHGGERVVPRGGTDIGGRATTINLNITGPVIVDNEQRLNEFVDKVKRALGRENELARWGVGVNFV